jgi:ureidoacrylate peracid hydrolase
LRTPASSDDTKKLLAEGIDPSADRKEERRNAHEHRYSSFHNTDLDLVLRTNAIRSVIVIGVVTNVCVETTAREAFVRDYYVVAVDDGCAAYVPADRKQTMSNIDRFFGGAGSIEQITRIREQSDNLTGARS